MSIEEEEKEKEADVSIGHSIGRVEMKKWNKGTSSSMCTLATMDVYRSEDKDCSE